MKDKDKTMQHALFSFALLGGLLVGPKSRGGGGSRPQDFIPLPKKPR